MTRSDSTICVQALPSRGERNQGGLASMLFAGDFCLPATSSASVNALIGPTLVERIRSTALSVVNLEGPIAGVGRPIPKVGSYERQCDAAPRLLRDAGFDVVTLANNHTMDFGIEAAYRTVQVCDTFDIRGVGLGACAHDALEPIESTLPNGQTVALFSVCEHEFGLATDDLPGVAGVSDPRLVELVRESASAGRFVVVCAHGGVEQTPLPPVQRRTQLRRLIDAGARVIIGHHPHVPQGWERYANGCIFYSLGDFHMTPASGHRLEGSEWGYLVRIDVATDGRFAAHVEPYERRGDRVEPLGQRIDFDEATTYLHDLSAITSADALPLYWQAIAEQLMQSRYEPYLRDIFAPLPTAPLGVMQASRALAGALTRPMRQAMKRVLRRGDESSNQHARDEEARRWRCLLMLDLIRCESLRWSIESAMAARGGDLASARPQAPKVDTLAWTPPTTQPTRAAA